MNYNQIILFLFVLLPLHFFCQSKITGTVYDEQSKQPIEFASVYIDGSTNGTMSDAVGNFHLEKIKFPCTLVLSHLSYNPKSVFLTDNKLSPLNVSMNIRNVKIQVVDVKDKNLRERNLSLFRREFLGEDIWGQYAKIENEEVIHFTKDYEPGQSKIYNKILPNFIKEDGIEIQWSEDSTIVTYKKAINLKASSSQPLKINLPLLGYTYYYDLIEFVRQYQPDLKVDLCFNLGYSYFQELPYDGSKRDSIRLQKNRIKSYYNSAQHFRKSLYEKRLAQNGYKVYGSIIDESTGKAKLKEVDLESCLQMESDGARIIGLKNIKLEILYYKNLQGIPVDLTQRRKTSPIRSTVVFINDTCIIRDNGTVPDNSIVFGPEIGLKKFGSLLPDNYLPSE